ncbi:hypothetical protein BC828DRAFT_398792 [Blastocladiella britannica]|nr:hypothetical protein BC828DRAFT_398792 [Blastocladiella britannica]
MPAPSFLHVGNRSPYRNGVNNATGAGVARSGSTASLATTHSVASMMSFARGGSPAKKAAAIAAAAAAGNKTALTAWDVFSTLEDRSPPAPSEVTPTESISGVIAAPSVAGGRGSTGAPVRVPISSRAKTAVTSDPVVRRWAERAADSGAADGEDVGGDAESQAVDLFDNHNAVDRKVLTLERVDQGRVVEDPSLRNEALVYLQVADLVPSAWLQGDAFFYTLAGKSGVYYKSAGYAGEPGFNDALVVYVPYVFDESDCKTDKTIKSPYQETYTLTVYAIPHASKLAGLTKYNPNAPAMGGKTGTLGKLFGSKKQGPHACSALVDKPMPVAQVEFRLKLADFAKASLELAVPVPAGVQPVVATYAAWLGAKRAGASSSNGHAGSPLSDVASIASGATGATTNSVAPPVAIDPLQMTVTFGVYSGALSRAAHAAETSHEGYLSAQVASWSGKAPVWRRYWAALDGPKGMLALYDFEYKTAKRPAHDIPVRCITRVRLADADRMPLPFSFAADVDADVAAADGVSRALTAALTGADSLSRAASRSSQEENDDTDADDNVLGASNLARNTVGGSASTLVDEARLVLRADSAENMQQWMFALKAAAVVARKMGTGAKSKSLA